MLQNKERTNWIDAARGCGIILVFLGHIGFGRFGNWIYSFHIPLFFFLSGMVFDSKKCLKAFLLKKCRSILIPYFAFAVVTMAAESVNFSVPLSSLWRRYLIGTLVQKRFEVIWFLAALFVLEILYYFILKLKRGSALAVTVLLAVSGYVYNRTFNDPLPWNLDAVAFCAPFFHAGSLLKTRKDAIENCPRPVLVGSAALLINAALVFLTGNTLELFNCDFGNPAVSYLAAFCGIAATVLFCQKLCFKPLCYIGRNSLSYYLTHVNICLPMAVHTLGVFSLSVDTCGSAIELNICKLLLLALMLIYCTVLNYILTSTGLGIILGRRRKSNERPAETNLG